jgi:hypothetical protein
MQWRQLDYPSIAGFMHVCRSTKEKGTRSSSALEVGVTLPYSFLFFPFIHALIMLVQTQAWSTQVMQGVGLSDSTEIEIVFMFEMIVVKDSSISLVETIYIDT